MKLELAITRVVVVALALALCGAPELARAWQQPAPTEQQQPPINGTTVNPSQGPLAPAPAPENQPAAPPARNQNVPSTQMTQQPSTSEPLGAAAAETIPTAGGGASRPAGAAIAPAKQHQTRSFLIKLGAVAATGIAIGTVAGLSKGTSSTAPGAHSAAAVH